MKRLVIPGKLPGLNEYIAAERDHRQKGAKKRKETERRIAWAAKSQMRGVRFEGPVIMHYTWIEPNRRRDNPDYPVIPGHWHPSIHMPREAARIFLRVTDVRVERLQEICGQGLIDEGLFSLDELRCGMMRDKFSAFEKLWNTTIKPADRALYGWEANPYTWVIEFKRISRKEAEHGETGVGQA